MTDKTFRTKINEEMRRFAKIYAEFQTDYAAKSQKAYGHKYEDDPDSGKRYRVQGPWQYLFHAPIESIDIKQIELELEGDNSTDRLNHDPLKIVGLFLDDSLKKAVLQVVRELKLHELRLGGITTNDFGITTAIKQGRLIYDDLEPLYELSTAEQQKTGPHYVIRPRVDGSDPFFWRTLLEIFCRAYNASKGRPKRRSPQQEVSLAFDLLEIYVKYFEGKKCRNERALEILCNRLPYKEKYVIMKKRLITLNAIKRVAGIIGSMKTEPLKRMKKHYGDAFVEEANRRAFKAFPKDIDELKAVIARSRAYSKSNSVA